LYLIPGVVGGTETYAVSLIRALASLDRENKYVLYVSREAAGLEWPEAPNFRRVVCPVRAVSRPARYAWEQAVLPLQLAQFRPRVVHSLGYVAPLLAPCPSVVTIHDLNIEAMKGMMPEPKRRALAWFVERAARRAARVITLSEFSRQQLASRFRLPADRLAVIPLAPGRLDGATAAMPEAALLRRRYALPDSYVAAMASASPHKNIPRLIDAFGRACPGGREALVLIGRLPPGFDPAAAAARAGAAGRVLALGYVPRQDLGALLSGAALFVMPSLYEGFGLPVLEAQRAGAPLACSTAAALPEVAGEGAVYFDPSSAEAMAEAIRRCLADPALRDDLRRRGGANLQRFSWERAARATRAVYEAAAAGEVAGKRA